MGRHGLTIDRVDRGMTRTADAGAQAPSSSRVSVGESAEPVAENLFVPHVEPTVAGVGGLGAAGISGRRRRVGAAAGVHGMDRTGILKPITASAGMSQSVTPRWNGEQYRELERAVEEVFVGYDDLPQTGELVRPFIDQSREGDAVTFTGADASPWGGHDVPPPTPVFGVTAPTSPAPIAAPLPTRRQLREQRKAQASARAQAARTLAKGGVLAVTMFGVVATNAPQTLHDRLFPAGASSDVTDNLAASLALGSSASRLTADSDMRRGSLIEDALRNRLLKDQAGKTVSEAGQSAAGAVIAAAKAQSKVDAEVARQEAERARAEARANPRALARQIVENEYGWSSTQFTCLDRLWTKESSWRYNADNPTSSAYGIPQALPGSKMASAGSDWLTNPETQIRWGLGYIEDRYGTPCSAWAHSVAHNWY